MTYIISRAKIRPNRHRFGMAARQHPVSRVGTGVKKGYRRRTRAGVCCEGPSLSRLRGSEGGEFGRPFCFRLSAIARAAWQYSPRSAAGPAHAFTAVAQSDLVARLTIL